MQLYYIIWEEKKKAIPDMSGRIPQKGSWQDCFCQRMPEKRHGEEEMDMEQKIKMVIVDLDGTLLTKVRYVPEENIRAMREAREAGVLTVIATGRLEKDSFFAVEAVGAKDYIITMNGLMIYDYHKQKAIIDRHMQDEDAQAVLNMLDELPLFYQLYSSNDTFATTHSIDCLPLSGMLPSYLEFYKSAGNVSGKMWDYLKTHNRHGDKLFVSVQDKNVMQHVREEVAKIPGLRSVSSGRCFLEVLPKDADKREAVQLFSEYVGIPLSQTMIIGDSDNDVGMLSVAGLSVAMGNGCDAAKEIADVIAPTNLENGVAWAIDKFVLGRQV